MKHCGIVLAVFLLMFATGCGQSPSSTPASNQQVTTRTPATRPTTATTSSDPSEYPGQKTATKDKTPAKVECKDAHDCTAGAASSASSAPILVSVIGHDGHEDVNVDPGKSWEVRVNDGIHLAISGGQLPANCVLVNNATGLTVQATVSGGLYQSPQTQPILAASVAKFCP